MKTSIEVSVIMPCLNEARSIASCVEKANRFFKDNQVSGEVIVADNGSTDGSQDIAKNLGAQVIAVSQKGYGNALIAGMNAAQGQYLIMGDSDDTYDFLNLMPFLERLREGYDLVMGNRFKGGIEKGAMSFLHRLGNPFLSTLGKWMFPTECKDFHCGLRALSKSAFEKMQLRTPGMEFASEMLIKASLLKLNATEVPTKLSKDKRIGGSHLRTFRDGFRHLRVLLYHNPKWFLFYPGLLFSVIGLFLFLWLIPSPRYIGNTMLDIHTLLYGSAFLLIGFQFIAFSFFSTVYGISHGILPENFYLFRKPKFLNATFVTILGAVALVVGVSGTIASLFYWKHLGFKDLNPQVAMRLVIPSAILLILGLETLTSSLFYGMLKWGHALNKLKI